MPSDAHLGNTDNLSQNLELAIMAGLVQAQTEFADVLVNEMPEATGKARKSVVKKPIIKVGGQYIASVGIEDQNILQYLWGYWKGAGTKTITAHGMYMVFDRWNNGPSDLRWKDGNFHFRKVEHTYEAHDFVGRAMAKFQNRLAEILNGNITMRFK